MSKLKFCKKNPNEDRLKQIEFDKLSFYTYVEFNKTRSVI